MLLARSALRARPLARRPPLFRRLGCQSHSQFRSQSSAHAATAAVPAAGARDAVSEDEGARASDAFELVDAAVLENMFKSLAQELHGDPAQLVIAREDVAPLLRALGESPEDAHVDDIMHLADADDDDRIDLRSFLAASAQVLPSPDADADADADNAHGLGARALPGIDELVDRFETLDTDGDGLLTAGDLEGVLTSGGRVFDREMSELACARMDKDGNHVIDVSEFVRFLLSDPARARRWRLRSGFRTMYLLGGPASGKTPLSQRLVEQARVQHVSCGGVLREEALAGSVLGREIQSQLDRGETVRPEVLAALLRLRASAHPDHLVLLDGFLRSRQKAQALHRLCGKPTLAVRLVCPEEVLVQRMVDRGLFGADADAARGRVRAFEARLAPMLEYLEENRVPVVALDAAQDEDALWEQLMRHENPVSRRVAVTRTAHPHFIGV